MPQNLEDRLDSVYQAGGEREKLDHAYDDWARRYDQDIWASGSPYIALTACMAVRYIPDRRARILDGGCGTGNLAQLLHRMGYTNMVGIDPSDGMLAAARAKGCYAELHKMLLGAKIGLPAESFDAVAAAGVMTQGHAPPDALDGMLEIAKPGAPIMFSISKIALEEGGFGQKIADLEQSGAWSLIDETGPFPAFPFSERYAHQRLSVSVYRKAG